MAYKPKPTKGQIIGVLIVLLICLIAYCSRRQPTDLDDPIRSSNDLPQEYLNLFPAETAKLLVHRNSYYFTSQSPYSSDYFDGKKYFIEIYKIGKAGKYPLNKIIRTTNNWTSLPSGSPYRSLVEPLFDVWSRPFANEISQIYLNVHGDSLKMVAQSDSIVSVYFRFNDFSLQYNKADTIRVFAKAGHLNLGTDDYTSSFYPMILTFLKRNNSIYLLIMSINDSSIRLNPDMLYQLIMAK